MGFFDFVFGKKVQELPMTPEQKKVMSELQKLAAMGILIAQKRPIKYNKIDFTTMDGQTQKEVLDSMKKGVTSGGIYKDKLVKKNSLVFGIPGGAETYINTYFAGFFSKEFEEKDIKFEQGNILVKGPLSELYKIKDESKLRELYRQDGDLWVPIAIPKRVIKISGKLFDHMSDSKLFKMLDDDKLELITSYGGTHAAEVGDYLMVDGNDFYRIKKKAFEKTYDVISEGLKKMISTGDKAVVGGCQRCVYMNKKGERFVKKNKAWLRI